MHHQHHENVTGDTRFCPLAAGNEELIRPLFKEVFGHEISSALLQWKYGGGRGLSWVGWGQDGHPLVHCGLSFRTALVGGRLQRIAQLVDLMASPRAHGGISRRQSPFYKLVVPLLASLATAENPGAWAFGFPSDRAMRLGERLGVFKAIDQMYELTFPPKPVRYLGGYHFIRVFEVSGENGWKLQRLWEQMAADFDEGIVGLRDTAYLRKRYLEHPEKQYELYLVQSPWLRRQLGGFIVWRNGASVELMDVITPLRAVPRIVEAAREWLYRNTCSELKLWLASSHVDLLTGQAASVTPLEFRIMANPFTPLEELHHLDHRWWLTSGDTDYR